MYNVSKKCDDTQPGDMSDSESKMVSCVYCKRLPAVRTCCRGHSACDSCLHIPPSLRHKSHESVATRSSSTCSVSRRPIQCPVSECGKVIAVAQLVSHFAFEHARIHRERIEYRQAKGLALSLNRMEPGKSHCLALLLLADDPAGQAAFPLLAARLQGHPPQAAAPPVSTMSGAGDRLQFGETDVLLVWLCSNVEGVCVTCSLEMSDEARTRVLAYRGPVNSLRDNNEAGAVFTRADCLALHAAAVRKMSRDGHCPIDMKIFVLPPPTH